MAKMNKVYDTTVPPARRRFAAGTVSINGMAKFSHCFFGTTDLE